MGTQLTPSTIARICGIWGFGSFFRHDNECNDVDLIVVIDKIEPKDLGLLRELRDAISWPPTSELPAIDLVILTANEFATKPIRDWKQLTQIWP